MSDLSTRLSKLMAALPAILLTVFMNVFITSATSGVIMLQLQVAYPGAKWPLPVAILTAVIIYSWLLFNHKLRAYIKKLGATYER